MNHVVPNFDLPGTSETNFSLKNYLGKMVVLYFGLTKTPLSLQENNKVNSANAKPR